jgi:DNA-binding phage protein
MKTASYKKIPRKNLNRPKVAAKYLTACYEEGLVVFLTGLGDVIEAQGGVGRAAELSKLSRMNVYRITSHQGNPRLTSLDCVLSALGLKVVFKAA